MEGEEERGGEERGSEERRSEGIRQANVRDDNALRSGLGRRWTTVAADWWTRCLKWEVQPMNGWGEERGEEE